MASSVLWLVVTFSLSDRSLAYSIGRITVAAAWVALLYLMLAFPDGRVVGRFDRALVASVALLVVALFLPSDLLLHRYLTPNDWVICSARCPPNALQIVRPEPKDITDVMIPLRELLAVVLFGVVIRRFVQRIASASAVRRTMPRPVLDIGIALVGVTAAATVVRGIAPRSALLDVSTWVIAFALPAMALGFLIGLARWRLYIGNALMRFAASLHPPLGPDGVRAAFAEAFEDPSLAIIYPITDGRWAHANGRPADPPTHAAGRCVTELHDSPGEVAAVLVHDEALKAEPAFVNAAESLAILTLEHQRLVSCVLSSWGKCGMLWHGANWTS